MCQGPLKRVVGADQLGGELRHWNIESRYLVCMCVGGRETGGG